MPFITANGTILSTGVACSGHFGINGQSIPELVAFDDSGTDCLGGAVLLGPNVIAYQHCYGTAAARDAGCIIESFNLVTKEIITLSEQGCNALVGSGQGDWAAGLAPRSGAFYRDSLGRRADGSYPAGETGDDYTGKWCAVVNYDNGHGVVVLDKYGHVTTLTEGNDVDVHLRNDIASIRRGNTLYFTSGERSSTRAFGNRHTGKAESDDLWVVGSEEESGVTRIVVWRVGDEDKAIVVASATNSRSDGEYYPDIHEYANGMLLVATSGTQGDRAEDLRQYLIDPDNLGTPTVNGEEVSMIDISASADSQTTYVVPFLPTIPEETQADTVQEGPDPFADDAVPTTARPEPLWRAAAKGITPQLGLTEDDIVYNLAMLAQNVLQPVKDVYPNMVVRSGFRQVNSGISAHERGQAADIQFDNQTPELLLDVADFIAKELQFDQLILNYSETPSQSWIHVSFDEKSLGRTVKTRDYDDTFHEGLHLITPLTGEARAAKLREYESYAEAITGEIANLESREKRLSVETVYTDALVPTNNSTVGGFDCGSAAPINMPEDGLSVVTRIYDAGYNGQPWDLTNPNYEATNGCGRFVEAVVAALPQQWGHLLRDGYAPEAFDHAVDAILYKSDTPLYNDKYYQLVYIIENPGREGAAPFWLPTCAPTGDTLDDAPQGGWTRTAATPPTVAPVPQFGHVHADISASTWTASAGTSLYTNLDEPNFFNDADYIESAESDGLLTIQLREGYVLVAEWTKYRTTGLETYDLTVTEEQWRTVRNWSNLAIWLTVNETETAKLLFEPLDPPTHGTLTLRVRIDMGL